MKYITIGKIKLPETIKLDGNDARLMIYPKGKKWKMKYVYFTGIDFIEFANDFFSFNSIEEAAISMKAGLKINGYIK